MALQSKPTVTVITATYNRSNVLRYAIQTVLWQTFQDWEMWVIGDACTDDTEQVVLGFADPRIHFVNLAENWGEQSRPNNEGVKRAKGDYIAYLNHDDLWLPDHLEKCLERIQESSADLVFALLEQFGRGGVSIAPNQGNMEYHPHHNVSASSWLLRRELAEEIGPWRTYRECYNAPSQDWLFRAWKAHKKLSMAPHLTVVKLSSRRHPGSYARRESDEHEHYYGRLRDEPDFRERELTSLLMRAADVRAGLSISRIRSAVSRVFSSLVSRFGLSPRATKDFLLHHRKGAKIEKFRRERGLPVLKR